MKTLLSIVVASLYLAFSIGLTLHTHHCDDMDMANNELVFSPVMPVDCEMEETHSCCEPSQEASCCSSMEAEDDCCFESDVFIQIEEEQIIPKSLILVSLPDYSVTISHDFSLDYTEDSHEKEVLIHPPPPLKEDTHILFCSLTLYG